MDTKARIRMIRMMEKMEKSTDTIKEKDGTMKYINKYGQVLLIAKTEEKAR